MPKFPAYVLSKPLLHPGAPLRAAACAAYRAALLEALRGLYPEPLHGHGRRRSDRQNFWHYVPGPPGAAPQAWHGTAIQEVQRAFRKNVGRILRFANVI